MPDPSGTDRFFDVGLLDPLGQGSRAAELTGDSAWLQAMVDTELALTRALVDAGLAPGWMGAVCDDLADAGRLDLAAIAAEGQGGGNPVIPLVKHLAAAAESLRTGASDHLHVGATSQDILDTAAMLVAHRVTGEISARLGEYAATLAALADTHRGTAMAGRTLGQHASPTSFGFVVAGWLDMALTAIETIDRLRDRLPVQLGGAVGNLAVLHQIAALRGAGDPAHTVDLVLQRFAAGLGLSAPSIAWHTNRLPIVDLAAGLAAATGTVGAFALDVTVLARTEIAEVGERLGQGQGGSSAMPHKRNPVTAVLITAAARQTPGLVATLFGSLLAEDQRPSGAWHAEWPALRGLERLTVAAVAGGAALAGRLDVDPERMLANLEITDGLVCSERVTTLLAEALGKTAAFALVQRASAETFRTNRPLRVVLSGLLSADGHDEQLRAGVWAAFDLDPAQGGPGIDRVLDRFRGATHDPNPDAFPSTEAVRTSAP
ncbi:3-carboxy-cis,cis-muconate cycloisomerase [Cryobacterium sp. MP_M5]|uniref:lyase family protein n=1 Tax=unclassified Cryobacterium TaxID=2649013 RepID=UPI0018CA3424|nr:MULTISPECIES: lyase family protein [unclassified Cryobacterium]MBG6059899.1 3-carboxy-cis,cis-muconate cycloisomerase [Cryobacterium sp. MP_M3]MEC5178291.1 3-carboxy-cis,cis-muconate cycloisomerase [Cryobacterium sp. MP_M5]